MVVLCNRNWKANQHMHVNAVSSYLEGQSPLATVKYVQPIKSFNKLNADTFVQKNLSYLNVEMHLR